MLHSQENCKTASLVRHVAEDLCLQHYAPKSSKRKKLYYFTFCSVDVLICTVGVWISNCYSSLI